MGLHLLESLARVSWRAAKLIAMLGTEQSLLTSDESDLLVVALLLALLIRL